VLAPSLDASTPWITQPTQGGATLEVAPGEVRVGRDDRRPRARAG
jgi:hypothetical protein